MVSHQTDWEQNIIDNAVELFYRRMASTRAKQQKQLLKHMTRQKIYFQKP